MHCLYSGTLLFVLGVAAGLQLQAARWLVLTLWSLALLALAVGWRSRRQGLLLLLLLCSFFLLGLGCGLRPGTSAAQQLQPWLGQQLTVRGRVDPLSVRKADGYSSAVLSVEQVWTGGRPLAYSGRLRFSTQGELPLAGELRVSGTLTALSHFRDPGVFPSERQQRVQELGGRLQQAEVALLSVEPTLQQRLALWQLRLARRLEQGAGEEQGALLSGMVLGGSGRLPEETREVFTVNGLAHLLSVSGTHLLVLAGLLGALLRPLRQPWRNVIILALLTAYAALCGLRPPVLRALLMSGAVLVGGQGAERGRLLCLALMTQLLYQPLWLLDLGLQLSFAAAAGLLWLLPACKRLLPELLPTVVAELLSVTLAAQLAVLPLEVFYFHQLSLISLLSNVVLTPLLELATQLALLGTLLPGAGGLLQASVWLLTQVLTQARWLAALPYSVLSVNELPAYCYWLYYWLLLLWADLPLLQFFTNRQRRYLLFSLSLILLGTMAWQQWRSQPLTVYFLDVGQGDCAVVVTPERRVLLVDTGGLKDYAIAGRIVVPFLRSLGCQQPELLLLSHYDYDHAGAAPALLRLLPVRELLLPKEQLTESSSELLRELTAKLRGAAVTTAEAGQRWHYGEVELAVLAVPEELRNGNEASTLAALHSPWGSVLFTGDLGASTEVQLELRQNYTVLKAGHHGSRYSSSNVLLEQVRPQLTVISCGRGNRYGHPHAEALTRLEAAGSRIARTDASGCLKVELGSAGWRCYSYATGSWQLLFAGGS